MHGFVNCSVDTAGPNIFIFIFSALIILEPIAGTNAFWRF
jgi:hypothetical protein